MQDLINDVSAITRLLDIALRELGKRGKKYAESEKNYRVELAKAMLIEREAGLPVTILSDICRGKSSIAHLKFERDVAEADYKANIEAINIYKLKLKILENQIEREWKN